ncbi:MAG: hypothetical protein V3V31_11080 [Methylococcales bacterium]
MKMKFTHLVKIALLLLVSPGVFAATIMPYELVTKDFVEADGILFNVEVVEAGLFSHMYGFTTDGATSVNISASSLEHDIALPSGDVNIYSIAGLTATLKDPSTGDVLGTGSDFISDVLGAGNYIVEVSGDATGLAGGNYAVSVAPVPLPPAILLMGSAVVGLTAVGRRNRKVTKVS